MILLDTNACVHLLNGTSPPLIARFKAHDPSRYRISAIVRAELLYGVYSSQRVAENLRLLELFLEPLVSVPFDDACARAYGRLRADLRRMGKPIGANDMLIATTALAHGLTLVTHNVREFAQVPGLKLEDWEG